MQDAVQATEVEEQVSVEAENDKETSAVQPNVKDDSSCNEASTAAALIDEDRELALSAIKVSVVFLSVLSCFFYYFC